MITPGHAGQIATVWIIVLVAEYAMLKGWVSHKAGTILEWGNDNGDTNSHRKGK